MQQITRGSQGFSFLFTLFIVRTLKVRSRIVTLLHLLRRGPCGDFILIGTVVFVRNDNAPTSDPLVYYWCSEDRKCVTVVLLSQIFACKSPHFQSGRCWVRTSDLLLVREALYP
jgi:hypothetical protein